jgi:thiamine-monophosphate kinase
MTELEIVEKIRKLAGRAAGFEESARETGGKKRPPVPPRLRKRGASIELGIGDDCAIYRPLPGEDLLFTSDQMIEGVHFKKSHPPRSVGERALARSLSDIAAMGGEPRFCLVSLAAPSDHWILDFYRGLFGLARRTGITLAGGDLARSKRIYCDVTVCGAVAKGKALRRDGAGVGDQIYVSGRLGKPWDRRIQPRLKLGQSLIGLATSCIDLSDGLSLDLHRLCVASKVAAEIERVPVARGSTIERAIHGGEDYELLFTLPQGVTAPPGTSRIGIVGQPVSPAVSGDVLFHGRRLVQRGWDHFR